MGSGRDAAPLVTVVIPAWNRGRQIQAAITSVQKQTFTDWELVIVDDSSTDVTADVVRDFSLREPRIRLIVHSQRRGAQAARNTGVRAARGKWIAFSDSDDQLLSDSLEARLETAQRHHVQVVHSDCYIHRVGRTEPERLGIPPLAGNIETRVLRAPGPMYQGMLVTKRALERIGLLDERIITFQEWDTSIRLAKYYDFGFVPKPTFIYDCRSPDTISKDLSRGAAGYEQVFTKHKWAILTKIGPKALAAHYDSAADRYQQAKIERERRRCRRLGLVYWPFRLGGISRRLRRYIA